MNEKILILKKNNKDVFFKDTKNVMKYYACKYNNLLLKIFLKLDLPFISLLFGEWKKVLNNYDMIILFDNGFSKQISRYIKKKNKNIKTILWYWNSLVEYNNKIITDKSIDEVWTYNRFDAKNNNLRYNTQFYRKLYDLPKNDEENDVIYMGRNKGREDSINNIYKELSNKNIKCNFKIIKNEKDYISYESYLSEVSKSKCILDFALEDFKGLSLRPLEALFYNKKLITNNKDIKNYDFYNPNNIFILGVDNFNNIAEFLNKPLKNIDNKIIENYDFNAWLKRFCISEE